MTTVEVFFDLGGVALHLAGIAGLRRSLHAAPTLSRLVTGAAVLATIPVGTRLNARAQLTAVVLVVRLLVDRRRHAIATGRPAPAGGPGQAR